jgi:hypothetical protein
MRHYFAVFVVMHPPKAQTPIHAQVTTTAHIFERRLESRQRKKARRRSKR